MYSIGSDIYVNDYLNKWAGQLSWTFCRYIHLVCSTAWFAKCIGVAGYMALGLDGLDRFTKVGASILVMGLAGNAILPVIYECS